MNVLTLSDETRLAYEDEGSGPPIVFLHGLAMSGATFAEQRRILKSRFRIITLDQRGHGQSKAGVRAPTIATLSDDLSEFMKRLDLRAAVLVGWSMGAMVIWDMLVRHGGDRVSGVVVEDMSPRVTNDAEWAHGVLDGRDAAGMEETAVAMERDWPVVAAALAPRLFARGRQCEEADLVARAHEAVLSNDPAVMASLWRSMAAQDFRNALADVPTPTLVIYGARSSLYGRATSAFLDDVLENAVVKAFENSGHAPHLEEAARYCELVGSFAERLQNESNAEAGAA